MISNIIGKIKFDSIENSKIFETITHTKGFADAVINKPANRILQAIIKYYNDSIVTIELYDAISPIRSIEKDEDTDTFYIFTHTDEFYKK